MLELGVAIRVTVAFARLSIGLKTELLSMQQVADGGASDLVAQGHQRARQLRQTFAGPAQRRHRIAARIRLHQRQQIGQQRRILVHKRLVTATLPTNTVENELISRRQFSQTSPDRARRNAGRTRYCGYAAVPSGASFRRRKDASAPLVQMRRKSEKAFADRGDIGHR